ncbi:hypothetical protein LINPERHAP2_LOCUS191 [Linum perenne]
MGKCLIEEVEGETRISVLNEGLEERLEYLKRCVVFRFVGEEEVSWADFRVWVQRYWGVPAITSFFPIGDDLWLMECSSASEVSRIIALKRFKFKGLVLLLDEWIKMAGRSCVSLDSDIAWVVVRGIPLHLKSNNLIMSVGEACGDFLASSEGVDLTSARIKIKVRGELPEEILIAAGSEVFPVRVEFESGAPVSAHWTRESLHLARKGKKTITRECLRTQPSSSSVAGGSEEKMSGEDGGSLGSTGPEFLDIGAPHSAETELELIHSSSAVNSNSLSIAESFCLPRVDSGHSLSVCHEVGTFTGLRLSTEGFFLGELKLQLNNLPHSSFVSVGPNLTEFMGSSRVEAQFKWFGQVKLAFSGSWSGPRLSFVGEQMVPSQPFMSSVVGSLESSVIPPMEFTALIEEEFGGAEECLDVCGTSSAQEDSLLCEAVSKVASVIGLEAGGSLLRGEDFAIKLGKEVSRRRTPAVRRSRTERELRRLGPSPDTSTDSRRQKRNERCVSPNPFFNEF